MQRAGLPRVPDADPDVELARRRARLPRAEPHAPGQVLRAAAGAAAVQAAADGRRLRSLLPDRALLPRRGRARRSLAGRVLSARRRDVVRHAGRRVRARSSRCSPASSASSPTGRSRRRRSRASRTTMRWRCTGATSRTCAIRSRPPTSRRSSADRSSPSSRRRSRRASVVRAIPAPGAASKSRSFFDKTVGLGRDARPRRPRVHRRRPRRRRGRSRSTCPRSAASGCSRRRASSRATRCSSPAGRRRR